MFYYIAMLSAGGDVLKFAGMKSIRILYISIILPCVTIGDAILAFWRCSKKNQQQKATHVMENALFIQENYDNFKVGEDINLRMKLAISIGDIFIYHLGMIPWLVSVYFVLL